MKKFINTGVTWTVCLLAAALLTSCVSSTTGPKFTQVQPPEAGKSKVYIYRPFNVMGSSDSPAVLHNGEKILELLPIRTYFTYSVNPGRHTFETKRALVRTIPVTIDIENPGQTRYIRVEYKAGIPYAFKLVEVNKQQALSELPGCYRTGLDRQSQASDESQKGQTETDVNKVKHAKAISAEEKTVQPPEGKALLYVDTTPEDARVRIMNIKPVFHQGIELDKGPYLIEVTEQNHMKWEKWISLDSGETKRMDVTLHRLSSAEPEESTASVTESKEEKVGEAGSLDTIISGMEDPEAADLARMMQKENPVLTRKAARAAIQDYPRNRDLLKAAEIVLKQGYNTKLDNRYHVDAMAWICKYLGASGNPGLKPVLMEVAEKSESRKIRGYAQKSADLL